VFDGHVKAPLEATHPASKAVMKNIKTNLFILKYINLHPSSIK